MDNTASEHLFGLRSEAASFHEHPVRLGAGLLGTHFAGQTIIELPRVRPAPSGSILAAFAGVWLGKNEGTSQSIIRIRRGTLNDAEPTPSGEVTEADTSWWRFEVSASSTMYAVLRATLATDGTVTARRLTMEASPPTTAAGDSGTGHPPTYAYRKLFKVVTDANFASAITQYATGAQQAAVIVSAWSCSTLTKNVIFLP